MALLLLAGCGSSAPASAPSHTLSVGPQIPDPPMRTASPECRSLPSLATVKRITGYTRLTGPFYYDSGQRSCNAIGDRGRQSVTFQFFAGDGRKVVLRYHSGQRSRTIRDAVVTFDGRLYIYRNGYTYSVDLGVDEPRLATQVALLRAWHKL